jgi:rod shape-determining protein MreC
MLDSVARVLFESASDTAEPDAATHIIELEAQLAQLREENTALKRDLQVRGDTAPPRALGRVLFYDPDPARHALRMTLPADHGVSAGDGVLAPGGILIGRVERATARSAEVLLLSDPASEVGVRIGQTDGLLVGRGDGLLAVTLIPAADAPGEGDVVVTNGDDARIPAGIPVGSVATAEEAEGDPFARLGVLPAAPLSALNTLTVIPTGAAL